MTGAQRGQGSVCCFAAVTPVLAFFRKTLSSQDEETESLLSKEVVHARIPEACGRMTKQRAVVAGALKNIEVLNAETGLTSKEKSITPSTTSPTSLLSDGADLLSQTPEALLVPPEEEQVRHEQKEEKQTQITKAQAFVPNLLLDLPSLVPVALFLNFSEVSRLILARKAVLESLTAPPPPPSKTPSSWGPTEAEEDAGGQKPCPKLRLVVPVVEVKLETTDILKRVSPHHVSILRLWSRASVEEVKRILKEEGPQAFMSLEKFVGRGCSLHLYDADFLAKVFAGPKMKIVNMEKNQLRDEVLQALVKNGALARSVMDTLCIRFNQISDPGALAIAEVLRTHETLETVNLKMNRVTDKGAAALAEVLKQNDTLRLLNLRRQMPGLTDKTARVMASALESNDSLRKLRLRRNKITDEGAIFLAQALEERFLRLQRRREKRTMEDEAMEEVFFELDLEENRIGLKGALSLVRCLRRIGKAAQAEFCLFGNPNLERALLRQALKDNGEDPTDADDLRLKIELSKPEGL